MGRIKMATKICPLCLRPHNMITDCCNVCNSKLIDLVKELRLYYPKASINKVYAVKEKYKCDDVFEFICNNHDTYFENFGDKWMRIIKYKQYLEKVNSNQFKNEVLEETDCIPLYIKEFLHDKNKTPLSINGPRINPSIKYICHSCGQEIVQSWNSIVNRDTHNCQFNKSKGEFLVEQFFKRKRYKTLLQYDTLICINPTTKMRMPYDIEIPNLKLIIEVQGEQHLKYIPHFHKDINGFYHRQDLDNYKKEFAEKQGYRVIYITYDEIENESYLEKLTKIITEQKLSLKKKNSQ